MLLSGLEPAPPGYNLPPHSGLGCKGPERNLSGATAMKPWKTSSATNETRNADPSARVDPQWSGYGRILAQRHVAKTGNQPGSRGPAICSLPDFPEFAQAVGYGVPGTWVALWLSGTRPDMIMKLVRLAVFCPMWSRVTPGR
jgi:hypothetical protein